MKALLIALALLQAPTDTLPDLSRPWSLPQCIHWALEHNLSVAQQEATLERSAIDKNTAEWSWVPNLNASASENWSFGRGIGGDNTYKSGNSASTGFNLSSSMPLFDGLATPRRIQLARLNLEAATQDHSAVFLSTALFSRVMVCVAMVRLCSSAHSVHSSSVQGWEKSGRESVGACKASARVRSRVVMAYLVVMICGPRTTSSSDRPLLISMLTPSERPVFTSRRS